MPPPVPSLASPPGLKSELSDDGSRHSVDAEDAPEPSPEVVDLRLKAEPSSIASFAQHMQAIQHQVQTDKMVETVTAAIFNSADPGGSIYAEPVAPLPMLIPSKTEITLGRDMNDAMGKIEMRADAEAKLDELVNSRAEDHLGGPRAPSAPGDALLMPDAVMPTSVKTPPAAVKSMILNAAAEILTSDTTMNALVTSAINTANSLSTDAGSGSDEVPPAEPAANEAPLSAMSQAVSQAVTQAVSQAVSQAVTQAVTQEMSAPVQRLTDMSDSDLLSYINPSTFDQM